MVYFSDAKAYFEQSKQLLKARPSTTKISTKYTLPKPTAKSAKSAARQKAKNNPTTTEDSSNPTTSSSTNAATAAAGAPKAVLTLRTYDPVSGTVLKYQTDKQAEVGRLIAGLGRCARTMAALPDEEEGAATELVGGQAEAEAGPSAATATPAAGPAGQNTTPRAGTPVQSGKAGGGGGGGGGKKKKNKNKK